jgi:hypothetical protein
VGTNVEVLAKCNSEKVSVCHLRSPSFIVCNLAIPPECTFHKDRDYIWFIPVSPGPKIVLGILYVLNKYLQDGWMDGWKDEY